MKNKNFILITALVLAICINGCGIKNNQSDTIQVKKYDKFLYQDELETDLISENLGHISYLKLDIVQDKNSIPTLGFESKFNAEEILKKRFDILNIKAPPITANEASWAINTYKNTSKKQYYGINLKPISNEWFNKLRKNANTDSFGKVSLAAITTTNTSIRNLPTDEPILFNPTRAGEGFPFDYLQLSHISIGYPLYVSHFSLDGAWAFIGNDNVWGWVKSSDIKILSKDEILALQKSKFIVITKEKEPVYDKDGKFLFFGRIGAILPITSENEFKFKGFLYTQSGFTDFEISKQNAELFPLAFNTANLKNIAGELLGQSYGWGGFGANRDCSLFLQDYLGEFGIWLPRNSKAQGQIGEKINLKGLSNKKKKELIKTKAVPFLTLFYMPGHVMLYVGTSGDEILALHDAWGLRTKDNGRAMIGGVAITSLEIGKNEPNIEPKNLLLSKIVSMNILKNPLSISSLPPTNTRINQKQNAISMAYNVKIKNNEVLLENLKIKFDDGKIKNKNELLNEADVEDMFAEIYDFNSSLPPTNDAGRYRNYDFFDAIYGDNEKNVKENLVDIVWLKSHVNKKFKFNSKNGAAAALQNVSNELDLLVKNEPQMLKFLDNPSGTFNWRVIAKTNRKSAHSYGIAIDINTDKSDYWQWSKDGKYHNQIPAKIVEIFERYGFIWGGRWISFDTMHFEYRPEFKEFYKFP